MARSTRSGATGRPCAGGPPASAGAASVVELASWRPPAGRSWIQPARIPLPWTRRSSCWWPAGVASTRRSSPSSRRPSSFAMHRSRAWRPGRRRCRRGSSHGTGRPLSSSPMVGASAACSTATGSGRLPSRSGATASSCAPRKPGSCPRPPATLSGAVAWGPVSCSSSTRRRAESSRTPTRSETHWPPRPQGDPPRPLASRPVLDPPQDRSLDPDAVRRHQLLFGLDAEALRMTVTTMATTGREPIWSMGDDTPLAVVARRHRGVSAYLRQAFAQVTNPPIDPERERVVMSLDVPVGPRPAAAGPGSPGRAALRPARPPDPRPSRAGRHARPGRDRPERRRALADRPARCDLAGRRRRVRAGGGRGPAGGPGDGRA